MVLSSWQGHCESSPGSFDECRLSAEVAANPQTKPTDLDCESARKKWQLPSTSTIAILLLLSPRADTHFTVPRRVEGWVNLGTAVRVCSPCPRLYLVLYVEKFLITSFSLPFSLLSLWDWPLTWKTIILQCYYTVGWVIWPVKLSPKWPIMCWVGR